MQRIHSDSDSTVHLCVTKKVFLSERSYPMKIYCDFFQMYCKKASF